LGCGETLLRSNADLESFQGNPSGDAVFLLQGLFIDKGLLFACSFFIQRKFMSLACRLHVAWIYGKRLV
jgi:hypothetical protein